MAARRSAVSSKSKSKNKARGSETSVAEKGRTKTRGAQKASAPEFSGFTRDAIGFLVELSHHNDRDWFKANQSRYEALVREPALAFIRALGPRLKSIAPHFVASDKRVGGSLMRPQRDTRFGANKDPYKLNVGIHFRHEVGKDVHAPGYYFHFDPERAFLGAGVWHPDAPALLQIRKRIVSHSKEYVSASSVPPFARDFELGGDSLARAPRGFDPEHPQIVALKRKDHIAVRDFEHELLFSPQIVDYVAAAFDEATPFMRFLHRALGLTF